MKKLFSFVCAIVCALSLNAATYGIGSNLNEWTPTADPMTETDGVASCTITLTGGTTFQFSVVEDGTWLKNTETVITRENASTPLLLADIGGFDNIQLSADVDGDYVFQFTIAAKTLVVVYPGAEGIDNVQSEQKASKIISNGQLLIVRKGVTYNMVGQVVE